MGGLYFCSTKMSIRYTNNDRNIFYFLLIKCQTFYDGTRHHSSIRHVTTTAYRKDKISVRKNCTTCQGRRLLRGRGAIRFWPKKKQNLCLTFPACFSLPIIFSNLNSNCSNVLDLRNLQE